MRPGEAQGVGDGVGEGGGVAVGCGVAVGGGVGGRDGVAVGTKATAAFVGNGDWVVQAISPSKITSPRLIVTRTVLPCHLVNCSIRQFMRWFG